MIFKSSENNIPDYSIDGPFGKVRLFRADLSADCSDNIFTFSIAGWHSCNSLYKIRRDNGLDDYLLFLTLSGSGNISIGENNITAEPDSLVVLPPGVPHEYHASDSWEFYWIHLTGTSSYSFCNELIKDGKYYKRLRNVSIPAQKIQRLIIDNRYNIRNTPHDNSLIISELLHKLIQQTSSEDHFTEDGSFFMNRAYKCLDEAKDINVSLDHIAKELHLSKTHTIRLFRKYTGMTPCRFIEYHRITKARDLLEFTDLSVKEIALKTGFCSPSHFISAFKRIYSDTPGSIRRFDRH